MANSLARAALANTAGILDPYSSNDFKDTQKEGFSVQHKNSPTKRYNLQLIREQYSQYDKIELVEIQHQFALDFAKRFVEDGMVNIELRHDRHGMRTFYEAQMNVAEPGITNMMIDRNVFTAHGMEWSEDDLKKAVLETFPERFL